MPKILNEKWPSFAELWKDFRPPLRPSPGERKNYYRFLHQAFGRKNNIRVLMFGGTPEIRDILARLQYQVTIVDINPKMIAAMNKLVKAKKRNEKIIYRNWTKLDFPAASFDLAIGDQILNNISFKDWDSLFHNLKRILVPGGYFISNFMINVFNKNYFFKKFYRDYRKDPKWFHDIKNKYYALYKMVYTDPLYWSGSKKYMIWPSVDELARGAKKYGLNFSGAELEKIGHHIHGRFFCYTPKRSDLEKILKRNFSLVSSASDKSHPVFSSYRLYLLKNT